MIRARDVMPEHGRPARGERAPSNAAGIPRKPSTITLPMLLDYGGLLSRACCTTLLVLSRGSLKRPRHQRRRRLCKIRRPKYGSAPSRTGGTDHRMPARASRCADALPTGPSWRWRASPAATRPSGPMQLQKTASKTGARARAQEGGSIMSRTYSEADLAGLEDKQIAVLQGRPVADGAR